MTTLRVSICEDNLADGAIEGLLNQHLAEMFKYSPPESVHALDSEKLRDPSMTFWSARINGQVAGCGALKELDSYSAEIKSMKTANDFIRRGIAAKLLEKMISIAHQRAYDNLYLETGSHEAFTPAINLYLKYGFKECGPFANYKLDPFSKILQFKAGWPLIFCLCY